MMLSDGLMNKQIAYELSISEATVKAHVSAILQKLNADSRTQAVIAASRSSRASSSSLSNPTFSRSLRGSERQNTAGEGPERRGLLDGALEAAPGAMARRGARPGDRDHAVIDGGCLGQSVL